MGLTLGIGVIGEWFHDIGRIGDIIIIIEFYYWISIAPNIPPRGAS